MLEENGDLEKEGLKKKFRPTYVSQLYVVPAVDAVDAGKGQLEISVNQGRVPNNVQMQGAGRCLVTFIPQHPGKYIIDVTFNGEQVQGCPIRVDILTKQVGQSISTPIISQQTASITPVAYKSGSIVRSTERLDSPASPSLISHLRQRSTDQTSTPPEHPRSPILLQQTEQKTSYISSRWESSSRQSSSPRPSPWLSPQTQGSTHSPTADSERDRSWERGRRRDSDEVDSGPRTDSRLGYTVAQYGSEKPKTVSSRTLTDDGLGTITSTFTSETRYKPTSPSRTFEYSRGTTLSASLPDEGRAATVPTSYTETRAYEATEVYPVPLPPKDYDISAPPSVPPKTVEPASSGFVTDSRSYGFSSDEPSGGTRYGDRSAGAPLKYFGDDGSSRERPKTDVPLITTTYERYRERGVDLASKYGTAPESTTTTTTTATTTSYSYDSGRARSNGRLKQDAEPKDSAYSTSSFSTFERRTYGAGDSEKGIFPPPPSIPEPEMNVLRRTKEVQPEPVDWKATPLREAVKTERHFEGKPFEDRPRQPSEARGEAARRATEDEVKPSWRRDGAADYRDERPSRERTTFEEDVARVRQKAEDEVYRRRGGDEALPSWRKDVEETKPARERTTFEEDVARVRQKAEDEVYRRRAGEEPRSSPRAEAPSQPIKPEIPLVTLTKSADLEQSTLAGASQRTAEYLRAMQDGGDTAYLPPPPLAATDRAKLDSRLSYETDEPEGIIPADVVEKALTPRTKRKIMERTLNKEADLDETFESAKEEPKSMQTLDKDEQLPHSKPPSVAPTPKATPKTTPKLGLKFGKDGKEQKAFDFGKSKFSSKHEVVRRGKDVEVKLESLKLSKEDQLRIVVIPPPKASEERVEVEPKVKKSRNNYEISFKAVEVGTHKVMAYVNNIVHPQSPFPIRVYDASEIVVGEIPSQSTISDTVEFTVDAGRAGFGNLEMAIKDSENVIIPSHVAQLETGTAKFLVTFNPTSVGMHTVNITFNKEVLKNSPFQVNILETKTDDILGVEAKKVDPKKEREEKKREEKEKLRREKEERLETLKKTKEKESKKKKQTSDKKAAVKTIPSLSRVGKLAELSVSVPGDELLDVTVLDPFKNNLDSTVSKQESGLRKVQFTPTHVGDHEIDIKYGGVDVQGSPFTCRAYDPAKIVVGEIPSGVVDKAVHFVVDASEAGVGNLEVAVNEGQIPSMAQSLGQHRYDISFVPREQIDHTVSVRFNNEPVPGSPFTCRLVSPQSATASGAGLERIPVGQTATFFVVVESDRRSVPPVVRVVDAHGEQVPVKVNPGDSNGKFVVEYTPKNVGNHQIDVECEGEPITGSPFVSKAFDATCARLSRVENAVVGQPCTFTIDAARAGAGNMEIIVSVENRNVPNFVQAEGQAKFRVSFTPLEAKKHVISVRFNGQPIPGSPMTCSVAERSSQPPLNSVHAATTALGASSEAEQIRLVGELATGQVGLVKGFSIDTGGRNAECNVIVTDSHGGPLPVRCYKQHDDSYWVEFTPEDIGLHRIEVTFADVPVAGSPFKCEVVDPRKVLIKAPKEPLLLRQLANLSVNREMAGNGELAVDVTDPSGQPVKVDLLKSPNGEESISFMPVKLGQHKFSAKLAGFQVSGTPQTLLVEEQGKPSVSGNAMEHAVEIDHPASIIFDSKKLKGGLKVDVKGPQKTKVRHTAIKRSDGTTEILFTPTEVGRYIVAVEFNGKPITGSPFGVEVVDCHKVIVNNEAADENGVLRFVVQQRNIIDVDATAAGSGELRAEVRDWEGKMVGNCDVESLGYGKCRVLFTPTSPGKYNIYLYWAEVAVESAFPLHAIAEPEQPSTSRATPVLGCELTRHTRSKSGERERTPEEDEDAEHLRVVLRGEGLTRALLNEQAEFIVDASDTSREGRIACSLIGQKADVPVRLTHLGNNVYKAVYSPVIPGTYELQVMWDNRHVRGSPFRVHVDSHTNAAELIHVDTSTLKIGIINEDVKTVIDTRRAGPGQLSAQCMGPSKLSYCELYDHRDGTYTLSVRPSEVGKHTLVVKYSDEHVPGSPFVINVSHQPDASKVRVYGPGIEHGILSTFKSNFVVETKGAGAGQLTVRVRGPKGAFNVEMQREKKQERTIHCKYEPREPGDYQVEVKWHGEHVPGSPFLVMIVDTEQELQRFLRGDAPSPQPATPFIPPGWIGAPPPPLFLGPGGAPPRGPYPPHLQAAGALPPPHGPHGAMIPYGPPPPHAMRTAVRSRYANGY